MSERKELSSVQQYAIRAANKQAEMARLELQSLLQSVAGEIGVDYKNELWGISNDLKYLERQDVPKSKVKEIIPSEKKKK